VAVAGFAAGVYLLPILIAPAAPEAAALRSAVEGAQYRGEFRRDLADSDLLHWGEGTVHVGRSMISLQGRIAPGPDYKLYLSPEFVETEAAFARLKPRMVRVGDVKTFENFIVAVPPGIDPDAHTTVIVWCETFGEFITAARYR
jgi:Electron transfer DM13